MTKVERITNTLQETRQRRETQKPTVYELKLQNLSRRKAEVLRKAFLEAKVAVQLAGVGHGAAKYSRQQGKCG